MSSTVFISYSRTDSAIADKISSILDDLEITYFRDIKNINWGNPIATDVRRALRDCRAIIVIVSPGSEKSQWVSYEIGHASALRKTILPFLTHPSQNTPPFLKDRKHIETLDEIRDHLESMDLNSDHDAAKGPLQSAIDEISGGRSEALTGVWIGTGHQQTGVDGKPVSFPVQVALKTNGNVIDGQLRFTFPVNGKNRTPCFNVAGGMVDDRFIWLNYYSTPDEGAGIHFGTVLGELQDDDKTLIVIYVGYGGFTGALVTGQATIKKKKK